MLKIDYDVTIPEMETGFMAHWKKYALRRTILLSLVYVIAVILFVNLFLYGSVPIIGAIGTGAALGMGISLWLKPRRLRKKLVTVLETSYEEKYAAVFDAQSIEIETIVYVPPPTESKELGKLEEGAEMSEQVEKSTYVISEEELYSMETNELFLLFVNRALIYVFPKRCLCEQTVNELRTYFNDKGI
ncbi:MAG: hypothetical protein FWG45_01525 [Oscillospiraceae bacterium]|nr:hypothetical protein [Oscillospiraceae bacterium]